MSFVLSAEAFAQDVAGFGEQFSRFWSSLDGAGFDAIRADGEGRLTNGIQDNRMARGDLGAWAKAQALLESVEHLQRRLEAQLTRHEAGQTGGLRHDGSHEVVRLKSIPKLTPIDCFWIVQQKNLVIDRRQYFLVPHPFIRCILRMVSSLCQRR